MTARPVRTQIHHRATAQSSPPTPLRRAGSQPPSSSSTFLFSHPRGHSTTLRQPSCRSPPFAASPSRARSLLATNTAESSNRRLACSQTPTSTVAGALPTSSPSHNSLDWPPFPFHFLAPARIRSYRIQPPSITPMTAAEPLHHSSRPSSTQQSTSPPASTTSSLRPPSPSLHLLPPPIQCSGSLGRARQDLLLSQTCHVSANFAVPPSQSTPTSSHDQVRSKPISMDTMTTLPILCLVSTSSSFTNPIAES